MIEKEILNQKPVDERRQLLTGLRELRYLIEDWYRYQIEEDLDVIEHFARLVMKQLNSFVK